MRILFAAGGTGGHINPALAVAGEIRERYPDAEILFVGTKEKMEARLVPAAGFDFTNQNFGLPASAYTGKYYKKHQNRLVSAYLRKTGEKNYKGF